MLSLIGLIAVIGVGYYVYKHYTAVKAKVEEQLNALDDDFSGKS